MGTSGCRIDYLYPSPIDPKAELQVHGPDGTMVLGIGVYATEEADGTIRAQLELRSADQSVPITTPGPWVGTTGYAVGRQRIVVEMDPESGDLAPLRFSIHIPRKTRSAGQNARPTEAEFAAVQSARKAMETVRERCRDTDDCHYPICLMAPFGSSGKLADDGCISKLVALSAFLDDAQNPGSQ